MMQTHTLTLLANYQAEDLLWCFGNMVMVLMFCAAHEAAIRTRLPIRKVLLDRASRTARVVVAGIARGGESVRGPLSGAACLACSVAREFAGEFPSMLSVVDTTLFELVDPDTGEPHIVDLRCGGVTRDVPALRFTCADEPDGKEQYRHFLARDEEAACHLHERIRTERGNPPDRRSWIGEWRIEAGQYYTVFGRLTREMVKSGRLAATPYATGHQPVFVVRGTLESAERRAKRRRWRARRYMPISAILGLLPFAGMPMFEYFNPRPSVEQLQLQIQLEQQTDGGNGTIGLRRGRRR